MKKIFTVAFIVFAVNAAFGVEISQKLLNAICMTESNDNVNAKGDYSKKTGEYRAIGAFQIWKTYVDDVNRISKTQKFTYDDRLDKSKSEEMVRIYLEYYGKRYERLTGLKAIDEVLARIHNAGPNGYKKDASIKYWNKVKKNMKD